MLLTFIVLWYFPYIDFPIRVLTWAVGFLFLGGAIYFAWKFPVARWLLLLVYSLVIVFLAWPVSRAPNPATLRADYCHALKSYLGCRYVWGGETCTGIDCSGFVRKGMEDALACRGISTGDANALRQSISLYWHDTNARVIGTGYAGRTKLITTCANLNVLDYALLQPGDLAVTSGGDHVMAYLGGKTWIAADPGFGKVTEFHIPEKTDPYFSTAMHIVRWKILSD
jgi:cell wall-associated NlpC family hydrolase